MATQTYRTGNQAEEGKPSYDSTLDGYEREKVSREGSPQRKDDPFGDETNSQVKYKVLRWW
jgi:hypothetical protein